MSLTTHNARRAATLFFTRLASVLLASFVLSAAALAQQPQPGANANAGSHLDTRAGGEPPKATAVRSRRAAEYSESAERPTREGESAASSAQTPANVFGHADPATILRNARAVYVRTKSVYFKGTELENELRRHTEFQQMNLVVTRDEANADLVVEVGRKVFTTRFVYSVIDTRSQLVLMSGKVSSVGGTAADKIAGEFVRKILALRALDPSIKVIK